MDFFLTIYTLCVPNRAPSRVACMSNFSHARFSAIAQNISTQLYKQSSKFIAMQKQCENCNERAMRDSMHAWMYRRKAMMDLGRRIVEKFTRAIHSDDNTCNQSIGDGQPPAHTYSLVGFNIHITLIRKITFRASLDFQNHFALAENLSILKCVNKHSNAYGFIKLYNNVIHMVFGRMSCVCLPCCKFAIGLCSIIIGGTYTVPFHRWMDTRYTKHMDKWNVQE